MDTTRDLSKDVKNKELAEIITQLSRQKFGKDVTVLEPQIVQRAKLG